MPGLLVPDIPLEETGEIREAASNAGMELVLLTTPTTSRERMQAIAKASQGFVYLVSVTGALPNLITLHTHTLPTVMMALSTVRNAVCAMACRHSADAVVATSLQREILPSSTNSLLGLHLVC